jgi:hypothetical protein
MISALAVTVGLLLQTAGNTQLVRAPRLPAPDPVRVWRTDSIAYVDLRQPGHLVLLHVDAIGRIQVLFPLVPDDSFSISTDAPIAVELPPTAQANPATFVAVRSRWPFEFAALRVGSWWDYQNAWLLQPTAGDPLAAMLDIADRITDGRPYDYAVAEYSKDGLLAARRAPLQPQVCLSCVRHGESVAAAPAAAPANAVDCSNASLTDSFCGVNSGSVSITTAPQPAYQPAPAPAAEPVYVPYYVPIVMHGGRRRFELPVSRAPAPARQPSAAMAYPIPPRLVVPSAAQLRGFTGRRH